MNPGSIVRCRNRDWVLLPSEWTDVHLLRPLTGATDKVVAVHVGISNLISGSLPEERVRSATFPPPSGGDQAGPAEGIRGTWRLFGCTRIRNVVSSPFPVMSPLFLSGEGPRVAKA